MSMADVIKRVLQDYDPSVKSVILGVLEREQQKIDMKSPQGIHKDIRKVIEGVVIREEGES